MTYANLLKDIVQKLHVVQKYTDLYPIHYEQIKQNLSSATASLECGPRLPILTPKDSQYDPKHAIPMATYNEITALEKPQPIFTLFKQVDLNFKLVSKDKQIIKQQDQGQLIVLFLNHQERLLMMDFRQPNKTQWTQDLSILNLKDSTFWIKNRRFIQNDHYLRYNLSELVPL